MKRYCWMPPPKPCSDRPPYRSSVRGRARTEPRAEGDGLAPLLIGQAKPSGYPPRGFLLLGHQGGDAPSSMPWAYNAKFAAGVPYCLPFATPAFIKAITLTLSPENKLRISRGKIVTRYTVRHGLPINVHRGLDAGVTHQLLSYGERRSCFIQPRSIAVLLFVR